MTTDLAAFFDRHTDDESPHLATARGLLRSGGTSEASAHSTSSSELAPTYAARARHLAALSTEHARRLHQETLALLAALEGHDGPVRCFMMSSPEGASFTFFEREGSFELLGALHSRDGRRLSESDWRRIWGTVPHRGPR